MSSMVFFVAGLILVVGYPPMMYCFCFRKQMSLHLTSHMSWIDLHDCLSVITLKSLILIFMTSIFSSLVLYGFVLISSQPCIGRTLG